MKVWSHEISKTLANDEGKPMIRKERPAVVYFIPELALNGRQHFAAIPRLLEQLSCYMRVIVVAEFGDPDVQIRGVERVEIIGERRRARRVAKTLRLLSYFHSTGIRVYFVRSSRVSALIAGLFCKVMGGRVYYWDCGATTYTPWRTMGHLKDWLWSGLPAKFAFKLCYRLVTAPDAMAAHYEREFHIPRSKIAIVPNDVSLDLFYAVTEPEKYVLRGAMGVGAERIAVIAHRFSPIRRLPFYFEHLLDAFERHPKWCLQMVGDGPERDSLEDAVAKRGLRGRVRFVGAVSHSDMPKYLQVADIFLGPSYVEGFPRVVIEAMACGLPMVVTDAGGTADIFPAELRSWVVCRDEPELFGRRVAEIMDMDESALAVIGKRLQEHVARYSTPHIARRYAELLSQEL